MRLSGITPESLVDGPGLRFVIFTQGCTHECPYCHNPETWDMDAGKEYSVRQIIRLLMQQKQKKQGITFSGGEPFLQAAELAEVAAAAHLIKFDVVTYTGFTYEELIEDNNDGIKALLSATDILIDGKYIHELRSIEIPFRGSSNQRIIDLAKTREKGRIVLWKPLNSH
jgi:anaerobic ribonucleoside-triphosphate reductase activating protein